MPVVNLTAAYIKAIKPPASGRTEYWDAQTTGLCLRVTPTGAATWSFRYRPREGGKANERVTFGSAAQLTLADARDRAAKVRGDVVDGGNPQLTRRAKREAARTAITFDQLAQRYLDEYAKERKASWKDDEQRLVRPRKAPLGRKDAASITRREWIVFLDSVKREAPVQANRIQTVVCGVFNWAVEEQLLETNPIAGLKRRAKETAKERVLTNAEIRVLWAALDAAGRESITGIDVAEALKALLLTGQRPGEVSGAMQAELVNLESAKDARWEIPAARMKKRRPHVVPLAPLARTIFADSVARRRVEGGKIGVFGSRYTERDTLARHSLSQALRRIVALLNADGADAEAVEALQAHPPTPHDFRRTCASGMSALGVPREDRLAVLAHLANDVHGLVYDKYDRLREKRIALETWERHLAEVLGFAEPAKGKVVAFAGARS
jgi:integrase